MKSLTSCGYLMIVLSGALYGQNKIALVEIASGFSNPVGMAQTGDERLLIAEKAGYIRIIDTTGQVMPDPFLDIDAKVNSGASERGLLGLAFHPAYADNGFFFVNYTNASGSTVVARYSRDTLDPNLADPASEIILMTVTQPYENHNGGHLAFGPDRYLYIGLGDGGNGGDPGDRGQNTQERLGKMMRIDVDTPPFAVPADNPFVGVDTFLPEIWAIGLRNPWRYSFDRLTGDLWIADVGQNAWEEINFQPANSPGEENYGWRCREGLANFNLSGCPSSDVFTEPVFVYAHTTMNCSGSVTGGFVYRGTKHEYLIGKYIFVDYCTGVFRSVHFDDEGNVESEQLADLQNSQFTSFGEDASGELYVTASGGRIYRIEDLVSATHSVVRTKDEIQPNPASNRFVITADIEASFDYKVYDQGGREVLSGRTQSSQQIDCSMLIEGVYVVEYGVPGQVRISLLVVMR